MLFWNEIILLKCYSFTWKITQIIYVILTVFLHIEFLSLTFLNSLHPKYHKQLLSYLLFYSQKYQYCYSSLSSFDYKMLQAHFVNQCVDIWYLQRDNCIFLGKKKKWDWKCGFLKILIIPNIFGNMSWTALFLVWFALCYNLQNYIVRCILWSVWCNFHHF